MIAWIALIAWLKVFLVLVITLVLTLILLPLQLALRLVVGAKAAAYIPMLWHRLVLKLIGVRVHVRGKPIHGKPGARRPLIIVSNHISWVDILVFGSHMPLGFIAKSDVAAWPGINLLARLQRSVFIERNKKTKTADQVKMISDRLEAGDVLVLFAEGTTGNGVVVKPFKSALFGSLQDLVGGGENKTAIVQPVGIVYRALHGMALGRLGQPLIAWPGTIALWPHLKRFIALGAFDVDLCFGEPIIYKSDSDRKKIARLAHQRIRQMVLEAGTRPIR